MRILRSGLQHKSALRSEIQVRNHAHA